MIYWSALFLVILVGFSLEYFVFTRNWLRLLVVSVISIAVFAIIVGIDYFAQTADIEIRSGSVIAVDHKEEWDQWHPEVCTTTTDDKGRTSTSCTPGYWEHHDATNRIKTSDDGWITVRKSMDGKVKFNDSYPNTDSELADFYPIGTTSASRHTYTNKVKASYSIFKNKEVNPDDYPYLPSYPNTVEGYIKIPRFIGDVSNKPQVLDRLDELNTQLNKMVPNPEKPGKLKSWKEVNLIFVNLGEGVPYEAGLALQDSWKNGNKNDFVVSFSADSDGKIAWAYAFSWSEVDILKLEVQDLLMNSGEITDFLPILEGVGKLVEEKFERKQFADFNYIQIQPSNLAIGFIWFLELTLLVGYFINGLSSTKEELRRKGSKSRYSWI